LFVFYFANGGYIIRIRPIAKGILVVPKENELMKSPLEGRSSRNAAGKEYPAFRTYFFRFASAISCGHIIFFIFENT
jgi:hypothetical protein